MTSSAIEKALAIPHFFTSDGVLCVDLPLPPAWDAYSCARLESVPPDGFLLLRGTFRAKRCPPLADMTVNVCAGISASDATGFGVASEVVRGAVAALSHDHREADAATLSAAALSSGAIITEALRISLSDGRDIDFDSQLSEHGPVVSVVVRVDAAAVSAASARTKSQI
jgi:hypothetical protein